MKSNRSVIAIAPIALFLLRIFSGLKDTLAGILVIVPQISTVSKISFKQNFGSLAKENEFDLEET